MENKRIRLENDPVNNHQPSTQSTSAKSSSISSITSSNLSFLDLNSTLPPLPPLPPMNQLPPPLPPFPMPPIGNVFPPPLFPVPPLNPFVPTPTIPFPFLPPMPPPLIPLQLIQRPSTSTAVSKSLFPQTLPNAAPLKVNSDKNNVLRPNKISNPPNLSKSNSLKNDVKSLSSNRNINNYRSDDNKNNDDDDDDDESYMNRNEMKELMEKIYSKSIQYKRSTPLEPYYQPKSLLLDDNNIVQIIEGTKQSMELREKFRNEIIKRSEIFRSQKPAFTFPKRKLKLRAHVHHHDKCGYSCDDNNNSPNDSCCDSEDDSFGSDDDDEDNENSSMKELERKRSHPYRLHDELWYNEPGEMNDGLLCRCSLKAQRCGIRHGIYLGEEHLPKCDPHTNNRNRLYHYVITITPKTNFLVDQPTRIKYDDHYYYFEGYSLFSHQPIPDTFPSCKIIRYNIGYEIKFIEDDFPQNFCVDDLDLIFDYIFYELLELVDFNMKAKNDNDGCNRFHLMPRFVRLLENKDNDSDNNGKELLSMSLVMDYLLKQSRQLIDETNLDKYNEWSTEEWNKFATKHKGFIVTCPSMKPCSIRVDQIDREKEDTSGNGHEVKNENEDKYPVIVHFGIRPPQLSYAGNPKYQKAWRDYVKYRHLLANKEKVTYEDKEILAQKEEKLQEMRMKTDLKRDVTIVVSSKNFYCTGIQCDIVQYSLIIPVLISHLRFHYSLQHLEKNIDYIFNDRSLLQLSLTHPSYRENFGTNPDHARNTLTNCGLRYLEYGDRKVHFMNTRKRGINMLINIMSRFGCNEETVSNINHNERLEFLGDAVVEFLASIHLYFLFPDLEEGGLATYRAALVQNQHLAVLAKKLQLEKFMLYAHGSDLCHDLELRHAMANCFEAFMGALFLDGGIEIADRIFSSTLFDGDDEQSKLLHKIWIEYPPHPIQSQYPDGDRHLIEKVNRLKELSIFEQMTGIQFRHIRLLARAFTHRSVGFNNLTLGSNQRMEFLGDTVLQLIASEYLYKYFPDHHEGHLSLLRSSLVNNKTQSVVCDDLGIIDMTQYNSIKSELKTKDRADLLEAFIGALYVDKGIDYCRRFCEVCFFPRLQQFIMNQDWNDPKSKLQQCCLTLRSADCGEPDIPTYKVIDSKGPTNTRIYEVAVYFRDSRLATGKGHSIQEAEMNAATNALRLSKETCDTTEHKQNSGGKFLRNSNSSK